METPPVEPDLVAPWRRNAWLHGLRVPFSLVFIGWMTFAEVLSPKLSLEIYLCSIPAVFLGLVVGAHYIDIGTSREKFSPFFPDIPTWMLLDWDFDRDRGRDSRHIHGVEVEPPLHPLRRSRGLCGLGIPEREAEDGPLVLSASG